MRQWTKVELGQVIGHRKEFILLSDTERYKRCRVQVNTKGIVLRDVVPGSDIKTKRQQICRAGDFLVAEIDAKMGGFGIVPEALEGAVVSSHYFLYDIDNNKLDRKFLDYFIRTNNFRSQVAAQGSTNYAAIRPADVLSYQIPLPSLPEQRRIIHLLDAISEKSRKINEHINAIDRDASRLLREYIFHPPGENPLQLKMSELLTLRKTDVLVDRLAHYHFAGVYSFGRGVFASVSKDGSEFAYERLSTIHTGDFIFPKLMAWEGALGIVPPECDGFVVSPEFPVFTVNTNCILPEVLDVYFRTPDVWPQIAEISGGTNVRRRRVQPTSFLNYAMPVPSMRTQMKLRELHQRTQALKIQHDAIRKTNNALIPATLERIFSEAR